MSNPSAEIRKPYRSLLERRQRIFELHRDGLSQKQIANRLGISRQTVGHHLKTIDTDIGSELTSLQCALADALTRERFLIDLNTRLARRLFWKLESRLPAPIVSRV